jgi:RNA polymerase-associated protein
MAIPASKRSVMMLYSNSDPYSHWVRIVLAEKGITVEQIEAEPDNLSEDLLHLNPYGTFPTLIDRDLVIYDASIIVEYLEERFPHPPLLPVYPIARAKSRQMLYRIRRDWYLLFDKIEVNSNIEAIAARKQLLDSLLSLIPVFASKPYFLSDEFTLVDCYIAPLLWRLPKLDIELPAAAKPIKNYAERLFNRETFKISLTETELEWSLL